MCSDLAGTDLDSDNTLDIANAITLDLQENTLSYNASYLIGISADYVTVQNGTLYTGPIIDGATNAVQITGSQTVLSNLTFGQTTNATIDISGSAEDITIKKCAVFPESSGSFVYAHGTNSNITVRNCVLSKKGIQFFSGVSSCTVENNSIYAMNTYGVRILASDSSTFTIKNNIFTGCDYGVHDNDATNDPDMDYNCYYNSVTADVYQCSKGAHAVSADPKLGAATPAAVTQFDLMSSSPCVGAGVAISGITDDYRGNSRKAVPSIGALEPLFVGTQ